ADCRRIDHAVDVDVAVDRREIRGPSCVDGELGNGVHCRRVRDPAALDRHLGELAFQHRVVGYAAGPDVHRTVGDVDQAGNHAAAEHIEGAAVLDEVTGGVGDMLGDRDGAGDRDSRRHATASFANAGIDISDT